MSAADGPSRGCTAGARLIYSGICLILMATAGGFGRRTPHLLSPLLFPVSFCHSKGGPWDVLTATVRSSQPICNRRKGGRNGRRTRICLSPVEGRGRSYGSMAFRGIFTLPLHFARLVLGTKKRNDFIPSLRPNSNIYYYFSF